MNKRKRRSAHLGGLKKSDFWIKVAYVFNQNALNGAVKKPSKMLNSYRNWIALLVYKWCGYVVEAYREKTNGANEQFIL